MGLDSGLAWPGMLSAAGHKAKTEAARGWMNPPCTSVMPRTMAALERCAGGESPRTDEGKTTQKLLGGREGEQLLIRPGTEYVIG